MFINSHSEDPARIAFEASVSERLSLLTEAARERMTTCSDWLAGVMGGAEVDFMTAEEKAMRHELLMSLPSPGQLAQEARARIAQRIADRRRGKLAFESN